MFPVDVRVEFRLLGLPRSKLDSEVVPHRARFAREGMVGRNIYKKARE